MYLVETRFPNYLRAHRLQEGRAPLYLGQRVGKLHRQFPTLAKSQPPRSSLWQIFFCFVFPLVKLFFEILKNINNALSSLAFID